MNREQRRKAAKYLSRESARYPETPIQVPREQWPTEQHGEVKRLAVWRSRRYLIQVFDSIPTRISVSRTSLDSMGEWNQDIPWDDLQWIKSVVGYGDQDAVEVYPKDKDVVRVANMRHLWLMDEPLAFAWRNKA